MFHAAKAKNKNIYLQKQPSRGVLKKKCSENMQQIYRRTPMPKCDFSKVAEITRWHGCSPVNLQYFFRTSLPRNSSVWLLLHLVVIYSCHSFSFLFQEAFSSRTSKTLKLVFSLLKNVENNKSFFINLYFFVCFEKCSCGITYKPCEFHFVEIESSYCLYLQISLGFF